MNKKKKKQDISAYNLGKLGLELIVVFLGVTAGFLLNNWRTREQEEQLEQNYINGFLQDVNGDFTDLKNEIKRDSIWMVHAGPFIIDLKNGGIKADLADTVINTINSVSKWDANTVTYEDITNSGHLNLIHDFQLKSMIVDYHNEIRSEGFLADHFYNYYLNMVVPFIYSEYNILKAKLKQTDALKSDRFSNIFLGYYVNVILRKKKDIEILAKAELLKNKLESCSK